MNIKTGSGTWLHKGAADNIEQTSVWCPDMAEKHRNLPAAQLQVKVKNYRKLKSGAN